MRSTTDQGVGTGPLQEMFRQFFPDEVGKGGKFEISPTGSGFVVDPDGDILTNHHVIAKADAIFVRFSGEQKEYRAELVGSDPNTDLALLRIDAAQRDLPVLEFADSDEVMVGEWAIAVGNPFGNLESSLTVGVVSAKGRGDLVIGSMTPRYQDFIQTDASINFGNSGGPLVDVAGRVIGVNTAINQKGQGIGFAVPSNLTRQVYGQLKEHGRMIRGYLGIRTEDVVQVVGEEVQGEPDSGARVLTVLADSPADQAGLLVGDIVVEFSGKKVLSRRQLQFLIAGANPGQEVSCDFIRDGKRNGIRLIPVEWIEEKAGAAVSQAFGWLGMEVASLAGVDPRVFRLKEAMGVTGMTGIMVIAVQEDQPGAEAGIRPGDVLVSIEGRELIKLDDWDEARNLFVTRRQPLSLLVRTGGVENYVQVKPRFEGVEN
ncbi:MAG: trypsin-like peptidase domain-containing protein [Gemmatimonadales bacterium]|nr:trypsin-like peptidase domain-containing protein [Gemmatimonadales bacterium]